MDEREKYRGVYAQYPSYGGKNHGKRIRDWLLAQKPQSVLDVGCGKGLFLQSLKGHVKYLYGTDIAARPKYEDIWFQLTDSTKIHLPDKSISWVTSFDVLEHLPPTQVDVVLKEMFRVCQVGTIFSICYRESDTQYMGQPLHLTVRSRRWWIDKLKEYGEVTTAGMYIIVRVK